MSGVQNVFTNYPTGFNGGLTVRGIPVLNSYAGIVVWVDSNYGNNGNPGTVDLPLATVAGAIQALQAVPGHGSGNRGDIIVCKPNHAETFTSANTWNYAGVSIVGMGSCRTNMPTFTFTTNATAALAISGPSMSVQNCRFLFNVAATQAIALTGSGVVFSGNSLAAGSSNALIGIAVGGVTSITISNNIFNGTNGSADQAIRLSSASATGCNITNNQIYGSYALAAIYNPTGVNVPNLNIVNNVIGNSHVTAECIELVGTCTGTIMMNACQNTAGASQISAAGTGMLLAGNEVA